MLTEKKIRHTIVRFVSENRSFWVNFSWYALFSAVLFFYYWLFIRPEYIYFQQQPTFFADNRFVMEHLRVPGGFLDILALYFTELFQFGWLGGLILTGLILIVFLLLKSVLRLRFWWIAAFLPIILLVMVNARYDFPLVKTLSLVLALEGFLLYRDSVPLHVWMRLGSTLLLMPLLYVLSPGAMFLFALLCVLYEALNTGQNLLPRVILPAGYLSAAVLLPWLAREEIFLITLKSAFLRHTPVWQGDLLATLSPYDIPLDAVLVLLILIFAGISFYPREEKEEVKNRRVRQFTMMQAAAAVLLAACGGWGAINTDAKELLGIRYAAHMGNWNAVLENANSRTMQNRLCLFHINRALYHTGKMGSEFFSIRQNFETPGLFLPPNIRPQYPLDNSDLFFELGHTNEAKRWASEALTLYGETPDVLKRLALVSILEGEYAAAQYLHRLRQNPLSRSWAEHYLSCTVDRAKLRTETGLQHLHSRIPRGDFIVMDNNPEIDLERMLSQAPGNRMACEYLLMSCLVSHDLDRFVKILIRYRALIPKELPRLYQEALLFYLARNQSTVETALKLGVSRTTINDFTNFKRRFAEHGGNKQTAYADLQRSYGGTCWFYLIFSKTQS